MIWIDMVYDKPYPPVLQKGKQMSRYIDADELERKYMSADYMDNDTAYDVIAELDTAPHIDIVWCKECRYCKKKRVTFKGEPIIFYRCEEHNRDVENDDYCSFGEREGE